MVVIEQILSKAEVQEFQQILDASPWLDGKNTAMGMASSVKNNQQADANHANIRQLANRLLTRVGETPQLISAALPHKIFPPCFNQYGVSEEYGYHVDAAIMRLPNSQDVIRSDVSMTVFLNEPEEYEGGELVIATEFGEQKVKLSAGQAVVYPSSSLHKVTAVTSGKRLAAITWMQSMIPDATLRQTLFQLDATIQTLIQQQQTDRAELDRLHNVYHNLIRQFSQL
ncbi:Fe2+-dependent dioxygenase [Thalassotalea sp. PLHSN55]|uniref:Fe2+-dependent dioxygenase n=1 Tax=Thalassotalea sp. PLHSN55 TaxID=3435888 RepID=UPI003F85EC66